MKKNPFSQSGFLNPRILTAMLLCSLGVLLALVGLGFYPGAPVLAQAPSQPTGSTEGLAQHAAVEPHTVVGPIYSQIPSLTPDQLKAQEMELTEVNPMPPLPGQRINTPPFDPPTELASEQARSKLQPTAPNDFVFRTVHDLTPNEASGNRSVIDEPTTANMGSTVLYAGNWYAARSANGGQSFSYVSPYSTFPSINNGFCCDQVVNYAPNQDMMVWALQYIKDSNSGTLRIARAVGSNAVANNAWVYYDFNPQGFTFPNGNWMDFPNITISDNYLYATSNVFTTTNNQFSGSVIWRVSLAQLAAGGTVNADYYKDTNVGSLRCAEGAHTTMYWGTLLSTTQVRIYRWDDSSGSIFWDDVNVNSYNPLTCNGATGICDGVATSPDGTNWAARASSSILGAWVSNGVIGLMWPAKQGGSFPYPYTIIARFNQSNRAVISQNQIWNPQYAWLYPTASVNSGGNLAGLLSVGGGSLYPSANLWISDDVQNGFNPLALYGATLSNVGPSTNAWGDYQTVRRHKDNPNTWVAGTHYLQDTGGNVVPRYLWFGRERDLPPGNTPTPTPVGETINAPGLAGAPSGVVGTTYTYTTGGSSSNLGHSLQYQFDWGDGNSSTWLAVGTTSAAHSWSAAGTYSVKAHARCSTHTSVISSYSSALSVTISNSNPTPTATPSATPLAKPDFNHDGVSDLLWQNNSTGQHVIWLMNPNGETDAWLPTFLSGWEMAGGADFDGDGQTDIIWENTQTGQHVIWLMNGVTYVGDVWLPSFTSGWRIRGTGDFNRDRRADILWQNIVTGEHVIWLMNRTDGADHVDRWLATFTSGWEIAAAGDFNLDGDTDILWQNTQTGQHVIWLMNTTNYVSDVWLPTFTQGWDIGGVGDFNGDGRTDIVWQNDATGQHVIWIMGNNPNGSDHTDWWLPAFTTNWKVKNH